MFTFKKKQTSKCVPDEAKAYGFTSTIHLSNFLEARGYKYDSKEIYSDHVLYSFYQRGEGYGNWIKLFDYIVPGDKTHYVKPHVNMIVRGWKNLAYTRPDLYVRMTPLINDFQSGRR